MGLRARLWLAAAVAAVVFSTPMQETVSAQSGTLPSVLISEFRLVGARGTNDEFIELFNASDRPVSVRGWLINSANNIDNGTGVSNTFSRVTIGNFTIASGCYLLFTNSNTLTGPYSGPTPGDQTYGTGIADEGGLALLMPDGTIVDQVGIGQFSAYVEGTRLGTAQPPDKSYERKTDPVFGYQDTGNNADDFALASPRPQNRLSTCVTLKVYLPYEIQGAGSASPLSVGTPVFVRGVVSSRKSDGFFIQTESGSEDLNPNTSEGLFVSSPANVVVGHVVKVLGKVGETVGLTQINNVRSIQDLGAAATPLTPRVLTTADLSAAGSLDQLEKYEGMLVKAPMLTAVSGTGADGSFYGVLTGQARPFREPGVRAGFPVVGCAADTCNVPVFDGNPELLRVDSDGLLGSSSVGVSTGALMQDLVGPLDVASNRAYTLLPAPFVAAGGMSVVGAPAPAADQFTVASLNLGAPYAARLAKASLAVRNVLNFPDVVGVQGVDDLAGLMALANQIDSDAVAVSQSAPLYQAYLVEGAVAGNTDTGFLVKTAGGRVTNVSLEQFGDLTDHPSLALHAQVNGPSNRLPQAVTVISNQLASLQDVQRLDQAGVDARARRQAQAESLANYIQARQSNNLDEAVVSLGDYNAFQFNDGYVDVVGTVLGSPAAPETVKLASPAIVSPLLVDAEGSTPDAERYSSLADGSAQALDHVLFSANMMSQFAGLVHARINADFEEAWHSDNATPKRLSDRDPLVVFFAFPRDTTPPAFDETPQNVVVEAVSHDGAAATFNTPTAHDNLDPSVTVTCSPASGSTFALGNTGVTCSTQDLAGNENSVSFTVTVQDTTKPVVTAPADQVAEATSATGAAVSFSASATDAVTSPLTVECLPASGSTFALGTTPVTCSTHDEAGNAGEASFSVTVVDTTVPAVQVPVDQVAEATSSAGAVVTFSSSATDTVTASLTVTCVPASGSTFAIGTKQVTCSTHDDAGNNASASFNVTVRDTTVPAVQVPANQVAEATSAAGAVVTFSASASDTVSGALPVTCAPASGSTFPVTTTQVTCTTHDNAGNNASASFNVTVQDTTMPTLVMPADVTAEATSGAGRVVTYAVTASDTVTAAPTITCAPASGSTFPIGTTVASCSAIDGAGNTATGSFNVTITQTSTPPPVVVGHMAGVGSVNNAWQRTWFSFDVRESLNSGERGWVWLMVRDGWGRPDRLYAANVYDVEFSNSEGYAPGRFPRSGIDTVTFKATGSWNGKSGYRFEITASDRGEPGKNRDTFSVKVYSPTGALVESASGTLHEGNIQSLR